MHSFRIPGLLRRAANVFAVSAIGLFGYSCQQDPPSAPVGPTTYTAEFPQITSIYLRPQSAKWSIAPNDSGNAKLSGSVAQPIAEIELTAPPNNTVWITAIRAGVKAFSLSYAYDNGTKLKLLNETKDRIYYPVNSEILRKIYPASDKQSFDEQLAKLLVDGDKLVDTVEISDLVAGGVDTTSVFREAMKYMVAKKQSIEQIAASWSLRIDLAKVHERIRLLAEEGVITDTSVIFPRYPVRVKDPVSLPELASGGSVAVQGTFEGDSGLSGLGSKVFQGDAAVSGFKLTFSAAVNGTQKTWDLAKDAEATLSADASVAAGTYTLVVWMLDADKRSDTSRATFQVKSSSVDNTPPAIEWIAPLGNVTLDNKDSIYEVKIKATDASGVDSVLIDGALADLVDGIWTRKVTVSTSPAGFLVKVLAKDAKKNMFSDTVRLFRRPADVQDVTGPEISWVAPTGETILENADSALLAKVTATDASGVESVSIDGGAASLADGIWSRALIVPVVDTGYVVEVVAKDAKGNETKKSSRVYRKAPAVVGAPVLTLLAPSAKTGNSIPFESTYVAARWKIEDATSEIDEASILIAGIAATKEGDGIWSARVPLAPTGEDIVVRIAAKNKKGLEAQDEFKVRRAKDTVSPTIVAVQGSRTLDHGVATAAVSWNVTDNHKIKSVAIQGKPVVGVDGLYSATVDVAGGDNLIAIEAIDSTGNIATDKATLVLPVDGTLPKIDFGTSARTVVFDSAKVPVVVKVSDDRGIASVWIDGVLVAGVDGAYSSMVDLPVGGRQILVKAQDVSGNTKIDSVKIVRSKDAVPPKIAVVSGAGGVPYETTSAVLVWKVTDNDRVSKVTIKGETVTSSDIIYSDTVALVSGENRFPIYAEDATGNKAYDTIVVTRGGDAVKPVITLVSPSKDTTVAVGQRSIELVFRVTDNEQVSSVKIGTEEIVGDAGVYKKTTNLVVGANTFEIVARDAAGNDAKATLVVTRSADTQRPLISRKAPTKDTTVSDATSSISLSFTVTDNIGVKSVSIGGTTVPGTGEVYARTVSLAYGVNMIQVLAEDSSGLRSVDTVTVIRLDQTKPVIVAKAPSKDTTVSDATSSIALSFTVTDNVGVKSVTIGGVDATGSGGVYSRTVSLVPGGNSFVVVATDAANNESKDTLVVTRSADATKPTIVAKSPSKDTTVADATSSIALSFDVTDNIGVKSVLIGGVAATKSGNTYSRTVNLAYGANSFEVVAEDVSGLKSTTQIVVTRLDQTKPVIVLKTPTTDMTVSDATTSFVISVTVTDNVGVSSVSIGGVTVTGSGTTYSRTVNLAYGANTFIIEATDAKTNSASSSVTLTRKVPKCTYSPLPGHYLGSVMNTLTASVADSIQYNLDGITWINAKNPFLIDQTRTFQTRTWYKGVATYDTVRYIIHQAKPVLNALSLSSFYLVGDTLYVSGSNRYGKLGLGDDEDRLSPVMLWTGVKTVAQAGEHTMIIKTDGSLWACGRNNHGQLGDGTTVDRWTPVKVASDVVAVTGGATGNFAFTVFLTSTGKVYAMGTNTIGELGDGTTEERHSPVLIATDAIQISAGALHYGILKVDGSLWTVGFNGHGQLGDPSMANAMLPKHVLSNIKSIAAGGTHTLALGVDGYVRTFGDGTNGQTFGVTVGPDGTPRTTSFRADQVYAGNYSSYYKDASGQYWGSGANSGANTGMVPTSGDENVFAPMRIGSGFKEFAVGLYHAIAVASDGRLVRIGSNDEQLINIHWYGDPGSEVVSPDYSPIPITAP